MASLMDVHVVGSSLGDWREGNCSHCPSVLPEVSGYHTRGGGGKLFYGALAAKSWTKNPGAISPAQSDSVKNELRKIAFLNEATNLECFLKPRRYNYLWVYVKDTRT